MTRPRQLLALCGAGICLLISGLIPIMSLAQSSVPQQTPVYNPYPPGLLPANLNSEIARVQGEINVIEARAIRIYSDFESALRRKYSRRLQRLRGA
jgi:hypothetical protein